jgi:hypothetical protein
MTQPVEHTLTSEQRDRLIDAIDWAAGQDARRRLGLPSEWDQGHWLSAADDGVALGGHCGTAGCIAGYVAVVQLKCTPTAAASTGWSVMLPDGNREDVEELAKRALGLTPTQEEVLFHEDNTLEDLIDIAKQILDGVEEVVRHSDGFDGY